MPKGLKGFQKGNTLGKKGRPLGIKKQVRNWLAENPNRFAEVMDLIEQHGKGRRVIICPKCKTEILDPISGKLEALTYEADRIKGKPKATVGIDEEDRDLLKAATVVEFYKLMDSHDRKELVEGRQEEGISEQVDIIEV